MSESSPLRILLVDESPEAETYVAQALRATLPLATVERPPGKADLLAALGSDRFDVVIAEARLSWIDGFEIVRAVKERHANLPVLMLTDRGDEDLAVAALKAGFDDYVRKAPDQAPRLAAAVSGALEATRERAARRRSDEAAVADLRREANEKTLILENMVDAVIVTDSAGRYVLANAAAGRLLGMDPSGLIGLGLGEQPWKTYDEAGNAVEHDQRPIVRALRGEHASMVQRIQTVDGREVVARVASAPVRDETGAIIGAVHLVHDATEEFVRARQVAEGARLRSLGQLASGVAHDLNQYLGLVVGYGDLAMAALNREVIDAAAVRDSLTTMIRAAEDGAEGVRRLLLFARPSVEGPASRVELDEVLRETAKLTAPRWRDAAQQQGRPISLDLEVEGAVAVDGWADRPARGVRQPGAQRRRRPADRRRHPPGRCDQRPDGSSPRSGTTASGCPPRPASASSSRSSAPRARAAPAWAWRSSSGSSSGTAGRSTSRARPVAARRSAWSSRPPPAPRAPGRPRPIRTSLDSFRSWWWTTSRRW